MQTNYRWRQKVSKNIISGCVKTDYRKYDRNPKLHWDDERCLSKPKQISKKHKEIIGNMIKVLTCDVISVCLYSWDFFTDEEGT